MCTSVLTRIFICVHVYIRICIYTFVCERAYLSVYISVSILWVKRFMEHLLLNVSFWLLSSLFYSETTPLRETRFRGRRLVGYDWKIPEGYSGFVLRRMEGNTYEAVYDFDSIRVWKKDTAPTDGECFYKLGTFLTFVNNVRKRITAEEAQKKDKAIKENPYR